MIQKVFKENIITEKKWICDFFFLQNSKLYLFFNWVMVSKLKLRLELSYV